MQYSKRKARSEEKNKENQLLINLNDLQEKLCSSRNDLNLLNEYYTLKAKLEKLSKKKLKVRFCVVIRDGMRTEKKILSTFST